MNKTAVEWFIQELFTKIDYIQVDPKLIEQAQQMHMEQLADAWYAGDEDGPIHHFEQYYNETYGGNNE